jgi:O-antigen/teichoic acid export membrane protein
MDRLLLSSLISLEAVAWYATPVELITKVAVLPGAVVGVLFPTLSSLIPSRPEEARRVFQLGVRYVAFLVFLPTIACVLFAREGLCVWLGTEFTSHAWRVAQIIAVGSFLNSLATVPFAYLQAAGRADLTAKTHLVELPLYVGLVFWLTLTFGIEGAALAWSLRMGGDLVALQWLLRRKAGLPDTPWIGFFLLTLGALTLFAIAFLPLSTLTRILIFVGLLIAEICLFWHKGFRRAALVQP